MPPKRKTNATSGTDIALDPSLATSANDDPPPAGPSKRAKTTGGKAKSAAMSAERKEANRLAAERSRVRRAERASILEETAKGLAEENLVLKERIKKLVAMGVSVDAGTDGMEVDAGREAVEAGPSTERPGLQQTHVTSGNAQPRHDDSAQNAAGIAATSSFAPASSADVPLTSMVSRSNKSSLHHEMETHFRQQIEELRNVLQEKTRQLGTSNEPGILVDDALEPASVQTQRQQIEDLNNRLMLEIRVLHGAVSRVRADHARARVSNERLRTRVREAEGQLIVKDGSARTSGDAGFKIDERRSDVQRAFKDVKRHLGLLLGHFNPGFIEPDLPEQEAFVVPAPYESAPLPEPQKRGRPPLSKHKGASSQQRSNQRKYSSGSPAHGEHHANDSTGAEPGSSSGTGTRSNRSKKRYEPSKVRYRLDADPDVIYIEEREIIQNEDGEQEIVHVSKKPVYNPRPRSGAGRKPGPGKSGSKEKLSRTGSVMEDEQDRRRSVEQQDYGSPSVEREVVVHPGLAGEHRTLHEAEAEQVS